MKIAEFETLVENAAETGHSAWTDAAVESGLMREVDTHDPRLAYRGRTLLTAHTEIETDTWQSGLNNNVLVLGCSGGGKTRHHVKPNLLQASGSYIVLDCKGSLYREVGPYLAEAGYVVDQLDFSTMGGTVGYNPLAMYASLTANPFSKTSSPSHRQFAPSKTTKATHFGRKPPRTICVPTSPTCLRRCRALSGTWDR